MKNEISKMEEEEEIIEAPDSSGCTGGKVRGGLTIGKSNFGPAGALLEFSTGNFNFNFECICASDVIIPIPASLIKGAAKKFLGKQGLAWIKGFLKGRNSIFSKLLKPRTLKTMQKSVDKADAAWKAVKKKINDALYEWVTDPKTGKQVLSIKQKWQVLFNERYQIRKRLEALSKEWRNYDKAIRKGVDQKGRRLSEAAIQQLQARMQDLAQRMGPIKDELADNTKKLASYNAAHKEGTKLLEEAQRLRAAKKALEKSFEEGLDKIDETLANIPQSVSDSVLEALMSGLFFLLDITTIVQEKNCLSNQSGLPDGMLGAILNPDTCKCSECPPRYKQLCDLSSWIMDFLPSIPGTRQSDELNVCMQCCDNAKPVARWFRGNFIGDVIKEFGSPPCSCECPTEAEKSDTDTTMVPMEWYKCNSKDACERGYITSDKYTCRTKMHPDQTQMPPPDGFVSLYRWDKDQCKWICKIPCGQECCPLDQCCINGSCGSCTDCPPGYKKKKTLIPTDTSLEECVPNCNDPSFPENWCQSGECCVEDFTGESNSCIPTELACYNGDCCYDVAHGGVPSSNPCLPCPEKTRAIFLSDDFMLRSKKLGGD